MELAAERMEPLELEDVVGGEERAAEHKVVVIVSAMDGMTEELLALADAAGTANHPALNARMKEIWRRHEEAAKSLGQPDAVAP